ncbi:MAG: aminotransferase class I/II-fold pyridoxal phosphate-dependent enzyme [Desulfuromonadaceae bacterium]
MAEQRYSAGVQRYIKQGEELVAALRQQRQLMRGKKFDTIAVHGLYGAQGAAANQGSIIEPAYFSTAQHFENSDHLEAALAYLMPSWAYSRIANPTLHYLEETLALLEGYGFAGETTALVTASGMAAIFMATNPFLEGAGPMNVVASSKCYGGTFMLFAERYGQERGVEIRWIRDPLDLNEWAEAVDGRTRFLFGEIPSNPALAVFDIAAVAKLAHDHDLPLLVDSTLATPALTRPLCHDADIVVHSVSKSITSSGFGIGGALISRAHIPSRVGPSELRSNFAQYVKLLPFRDHGPCLSPFNALMALSELRGLRSRIDQFSRCAQEVAEYLAEHPGVERVAYPGLEDDPGYRIASRYLHLVDSDEGGEPVNRYGHLLSFCVAGGHQAARRVLDRLQLIMRGTDLGRIKSVATIPAISTHQQQGEAGRDLADIPANLIRLSIGGEHPADILADLEQALDQ